MAPVAGDATFRQKIDDEKIAIALQKRCDRQRVCLRSEYISKKTVKSAVSTLSKRILRGEQASPFISGNKMAPSKNYASP